MTKNLAIILMTVVLMASLILNLVLLDKGTIPSTATPQECKEVPVL